VSKFIASCCSLANLVVVWISSIIKLQQVSSFSTYFFCCKKVVFLLIDIDDVIILVCSILFSNIFQFFCNKIFKEKISKEKLSKLGKKIV